MASKTATKAPRNAKRTSAGKAKAKTNHEKLDRTRATLEEILVCRTALPFAIVKADGFMSFGDSDRSHPSYPDMDWTREAIAVAETALRKGYRISFPCPPGSVAQVTSSAARAINGPVGAGYHEVTGRLILFYLEEDEDQSDEE